MILLRKVVTFFNREKMWLYWRLSKFKDTDFLSFWGLIKLNKWSICPGIWSKRIIKTYIISGGLEKQSKTKQTNKQKKELFSQEDLELYMKLNERIIKIPDKKINIGWTNIHLQKHKHIQCFVLCGSGQTNVCSLNGVKQ